MEPLGDARGGIAVPRHNWAEFDQDERQGGTIRVDSAPGVGSTFAYTVRPATISR